MIAIPATGNMILNFFVLSLAFSLMCFMTLRPEKYENNNETEPGNNILREKCPKYFVKSFVKSERSSMNIKTPAPRYHINAIEDAQKTRRLMMK